MKNLIASEYVTKETLEQLKIAEQKNWPEERTVRPLQVTQTTSINKKILLNTLGVVTGMPFIAGGITSLTLADWHVSFDLAVDIGFMSLGIGVPMMILCLVNVVTLLKSRPSSALNNIEQHLISNNVIVAICGS